MIERKASLRQVAAALELSRKKVLRFLAEGMPCDRKGERIHFNIEECREWKALNDTGQERVRRAAVLNPADPRFRERRAAAGIRRIKTALEFGHAVTRVVAVASYTSAIVEFGKRLNEITEEVDSSTWRADLTGALEEAIVELQFELPELLPLTAINPADDGEPDENVDMLPVLPSSDPRYDFALTGAQRREAELAQLQGSVVSREDAISDVEKQFSAMRARGATIPARVALRVRQWGTDRLQGSIEFEVELAKYDLRQDFEEPPSPRESSSSAKDLEHFDADGDPDLRRVAKLKQFGLPEPAPPPPPQIEEPEPTPPPPPSFVPAMQPPELPRRQVRRSPFMR